MTRHVCLHCSWCVRFAFAKVPFIVDSGCKEQGRLLIYRGCEDVGLSQNTEPQQYCLWFSVWFHQKGETLKAERPVYSAISVSKAPCGDVFDACDVATLVASNSAVASTRLGTIKVFLHPQTCSSLRVSRESPTSCVWGSQRFVCRLGRTSVEHLKVMLQSADKFLNWHHVRVGGITPWLKDCTRKRLRAGLRNALQMLEKPCPRLAQARSIKIPQPHD